MANKIDSNVTGFRIAEEGSLGELPGSPVWRELEPNSYSDFGGQISTVSRSPITQDRQRRKGTVSDLDASGGFNHDLTQDNLADLLQGLFFADIRDKGRVSELGSVNGTDDKYVKTGAFGDYDTDGGDLVFARDFAETGNNGLKVTSSATTDDITVTTSLTEASSPNAEGFVERVGYEFADQELEVDASSGPLPKLVKDSTSGQKDFTTLGLVPGEFIYIGGDVSNSKFGTNSANNGWKRVHSVTADEIVLDKSQKAMVDEDPSSTSKIRIFFGRVLRNEEDPSLITRRTYQIERTLGKDSNGTQSEYLVGSVFGQMGVSIPQADKITIDPSFTAIDHEQRDGSQGVKSGDRPDARVTDAFNTSSDFTRLRLAKVSEDNEAPEPLAAFLTELNLTINNNVTANKAIANLGAIDVTAGDFVVNGSTTAYFTTVAAVQSVRNNADVTLDFVLSKFNAGIALDVPLLTLGDGRANVQKDQPITLPLNVEGAKSSFGHTALMCIFDYLPDVAE